MKASFIKGLVVAVAIVLFAGCSQLQNFGHNLSAADCSTPAAQAAFVANLPPNPFVNGAQQTAIMQQACVGLFGTVAAPVTAAGNAPALPSIVAPLAAPVSPLPASK